MPIEYLPERQIFHLSACNMSYLIQIHQGKVPMHLYWGKKLRGADTGWLLEAPYRRGAAMFAAEVGSAAYSNEYWPLEYPSYGNTDFRNPAYQAEDERGCRISEAWYEGYEIVEGKPGLLGLPSIYTEGDEEAQTLKLFLRDPVLELRITLCYTVMPEYGVLTRHTVFENCGVERLKLTSALSFSLDMKRAPYEMIQLSGTALREKHVVRRRVDNGFMGVDSTRGISSHQETPFLAFAGEHVTERSGEVYGLSLLYSGSFTAGVSCDMYGSARIQLGINPFCFQWALEPGQTFTTPECAAVYSDEGLGGMSRRFHRVFRERLTRGIYRDRERPVVLNTWEALYFQVNHDSVVKLAQKAVKAGVELLVLDDGWFGHREDASSSLGDWFVNREKFPRGLDGLAAEVNGLGLKLGLWFEPEMVNPDSQLYRTHPDWCIHVPDRVRSLWRNQLVLDLTREDVCQYIIQSLTEVLSSANIEYVKWDNNRRITQIGSALLPAHRMQEFSHRYVLNLYRILEVITTRFPHVLFENCASGGARFDPGMMYYFCQAWTSDNTDPVCRLKIQYGTSFLCPPVWMTAHISASPNHQTGRLASKEFVAMAANPFNFGYELDLTNAGEEGLLELKRWTDDYKRVRGLVQTGEFYRLKSPFEGSETAWMTVSGDRREALVWYYKPWTEPEEAYLNLRLDGLLPDKDYFCEETNCVYGGDALMYAGLPVPWEAGDFFSVQWHLVVCDSGTAV